jgi:nitroreductase
MNETLKTIFERTSVRKFSDKAVEKEKIEIILKAAMAAPSACDARPWDFVAVTDEHVLHQLGQELPYAKMLLHGKLAIVVCGNLFKALKGFEQQFWIDDCSAASQNILLAAKSLGLGAVWTAVYPDDKRVETVRKILGLPQNAVPLNVIPIGFPDKEPTAKDKFASENVHYNKW